jgi:hypothetical protein
MPEELDTYNMTVAFRVAYGGRIEVWTDGSLMGTYDEWDEAGKELGDEFKHRMHRNA